MGSPLLLRLGLLLAALLVLSHQCSALLRRHVAHDEHETLTLTQLPRGIPGGPLSYDAAADDAFVEAAGGPAGTASVTPVCFGSDGTDVCKSECLGRNCYFTKEGQVCCKPLPKGSGSSIVHLAPAAGGGSR